MKFTYKAIRLKIYFILNIIIMVLPREVVHCADLFTNNIINIYAIFMFLRFTYVDLKCIDSYR